MIVLAWPDHEYWDTLLVWDTPTLGDLHKRCARKLFVITQKNLDSKHLTSTTLVNLIIVLPQADESFCS